MEVYAYALNEQLHGIKRSAESVYMIVSSVRLLMYLIPPKMLVFDLMHEKLTYTCIWVMNSYEQHIHIAH